MRVPLLQLSVADWIALGGLLMVILAQVGSLAMLIGWIKAQLHASVASVASVEARLIEHTQDHARHLDVRVWEGLVNRLARIEEELGKIRDLLMSPKLSV